MSRFALAFLPAGLLLLATASAALAKCPEGQDDDPACQGVAVQLDLRGPLGAGAPTEVAVLVTAGTQPYRATDVDLVFARVGDGTVLHFRAEPTTIQGRYVAQVELPAAGTWTIAANVRALDGHMFSMPLETLPVIAPPAGPTETPVSAPAPVTIPIWLAGTLVLAMLGGVIGIATLGLRRPATA